MTRLVRLKSWLLVGAASALAAVLPLGGLAGNLIQTATVTINQANLGLQVCNGECVQILQQYNYAVVLVYQAGGPDFSQPMGAAYLTPGRNDFGKVTHARTKDFVIANTSGSQPLVLAGIGFSGANPDDFSQTNTCSPIVLRPQQSCIVHVTFTPGAVGDRSAVLGIRDSAVDSPQVVQLTGTGVAPSVSPAALDLGQVAVGDSVSSQAVTISNPAGDPLIVSGLTISAPQADFTAAGCATVAPGQSCPLTVTFQPADAGSRRATLSIQDNGLGGPRAVDLAGVGLPLKLSTSHLDFKTVAVGASSSLDVGLQNSSGSPVPVGGLAISGANAADFGQANNCALLAPGVTCTIHVTFTPAGTGPRSASLAIAHGGASPALALALTGTGIQPLFTSSSGSVDFGQLAVGDSSPRKAVTLRNGGSGPLVISSVGTGGASAAEFGIVGGTCGPVPITLESGTGCDEEIVFTARAAGSASAQLKMADNAPGSPHSVALAGRAVGKPQAPAHSQSPAVGTGGAGGPAPSDGSVRAATPGTGSGNASGGSASIASGTVAGGGGTAISGGTVAGRSSQAGLGGAVLAPGGPSTGGGSTSAQVASAAGGGKAGVANVVAHPVAVRTSAMTIDNTCLGVVTMGGHLQVQALVVLGLLLVLATALALLARHSRRNQERF